MYMQNSGERNGAQRKTKVEQQYKHWHCCHWRKGTSRDKVTLKSYEINHVGL